MPGAAGRPVPSSASAFVPAPGVAESKGALQDRIIPLAELEKRAIVSAVQEAGGDKLLAARLLGIGKTTLYRKLKEYGTS
jgi:two-component system response regulator HydG